MKIRPVGSELFHEDEQRNRHEANSRFPQFRERLKVKPCKLVAGYFWAKFSFGFNTRHLSTNSSGTSTVCASKFTLSARRFLTIYILTLLSSWPLATTV